HAHAVVAMDVGRLGAEPVRLDGGGDLTGAHQQRDVVVEAGVVLGAGVADVRRDGPGRGRPLLLADQVQHQVDVVDGQVAGDPAVGGGVQEPGRAGGLAQLVGAGGGDHRDRAEHSVGDQPAQGEGG